MDPTLTFTDATPADDARLRAFLREAGLPADDVSAATQRYVLASLGDRLVGTIGLEVAGEDALLRSLAVAPDRRGSGVAGLLHERAIALARATGVRDLYVLTETAEGFVAKRGFVRVERASVPPAVAALPQFRALCPASAACLRAPVAPRG
jgi:amino-acid N-acetyltransferase